MTWRGTYCTLCSLEQDKAFLYGQGNVPVEAPLCNIIHILRRYFKPILVLAFYICKLENCSTLSCLYFCGIVLCTMLVYLLFWGGLLQICDIRVTYSYYSHNLRWYYPKLEITHFNYLEVVFCKLVIFELGFWKPMNYPLCGSILETFAWFFLTTYFVNFGINIF
jgi:hypothetical protein